jgi:hypothetical protein
MTQKSNQDNYTKYKEYPLTLGYQTTSTQKEPPSDGGRELNPKPKHKNPTQLKRREINQAAETANNL